ncbi:MAG: methyltransferase [Methylococcaceae bacterium]|nr:methyltransferase [Methylococcaceae bacterium]
MLSVEICEQNIHLHDHPTVWMPTEFAQLFGKVLDQRIEDDMKVLEIGIGSGVLAILAGQKGAHVTGFDIHPDAADLCERNWELNQLDKSLCHFTESDMFSALQNHHENSFELVWSNAPTFPGEPDEERSHRNDFEMAGEEGRYVLDNMITESTKWLKKGGRMVTVATSKQSWRKTQELMNKHWSQWEVVLTQDLLLADHYHAYIDYWLEKEKHDEEARIFEVDGEWYQRLYLIEGTHA